MNHLPRLLSLLLFSALCASLAYWTLQFTQPPPRAVAPAPAQPLSAPAQSAAASLFGTSGESVALGNARLIGVVAAGRPQDRVAILQLDGLPPRPFHLEDEVRPGLRLKRIETDHVMVGERRMELPPARTKLKI